MNLGLIANIPWIAIPIMAAIEDPVPQDPYTISITRPHELGNGAPDPLEPLLLVHEAGIIPFDFHVRLEINGAVSLRVIGEYVVIGGGVGGQLNRVIVS